MNINNFFFLNNSVVDSNRQPGLRITVVLFCFVFSSRYPETDTDSENVDIQRKWKLLPAAGGIQEVFSEEVAVELNLEE